MSTKFCCNCQKSVKGKKTDFSFFAFLVLFGIPYVIYHALLKRKNRCPICGLKLQ